MPTFDQLKKQYYSRAVIGVSAAALLLSLYLFFRGGGPPPRTQAHLGQLQAVCAACGHRFEMTGEQFRKANAAGRDAHTQEQPTPLGVCPSCGEAHVGYHTILGRPGGPVIVLALTEALDDEALQRRIEELTGQSTVPAPVEGLP